MQRYYRTVMDVSRLNEMLLQLFEEAILLDPRCAGGAPDHAGFESRNGYLEGRRPGVRRAIPAALLELFRVLQQHPRPAGRARQHDPPGRADICC